MKNVPLTKQGVRDLGGNVRRTRTVGKRLPEIPKQASPYQECPHLWIRTLPEDVLICSICLEEI